MGSPLVLVEITASPEACSSIRAITSRLTSMRSTTTSMIQSASAMLAKSSSKLPSVIRFWTASVKNGAGFIFVAALKASSTMESGFPSRPMDSGVTSRRVTWSPALARWAAIWLPMTPAPRTAAVRNGFGGAPEAAWPFWVGAVRVSIGSGEASGRGSGRGRLTPLTGLATI